MPHESTARRWLLREPEFRALYVEARKVVVEMWVDEIIEIADRDGLDPLDKRVRIDVRRWIMSKVSPQRFGDKIVVGGNGGLGIGGSVSLSDLSDEQLAALEALAALRLPADEGKAAVEPVEPTDEA